MNKSIIIQAFDPKDTNIIADLFTNTIHHIDDSIYSVAQKQAWAPQPPDYNRWKTRLIERQPFCAWVQTPETNTLAGFIELEPNGHIDCFYVSPEFQSSGVASALMTHLLTQARQQALSKLWVEASLVARPIFEHYGFAVIKKKMFLAVITRPS